MVSFSLAEVGDRREPLPEDYLERLNHVALEHILKYIIIERLKVLSEKFILTFNASC